ncbi:MAG: fibronectin type III domain-containing protein [Nitrospiraceae bacterium]
MPLLTGCGGGEGGSEPSAAQGGATVSLAWDPVPDPSVHSYVVYYGQQSPDQPGSCAYESSMSVVSPSATITNLDPNTLYYFTVSAHNGLESACSNEVSTVTPPLSAQNDRPNSLPSPDEMPTRPGVSDSPGQYFR